MTNHETQATEAPTAALTLLADAGARTILQATTTEPRSVAELVDECEIPTATVYRKVDSLVEADLLEKRVRIRSDGRNGNVYVTRVAAVTVNFPEDEECSIACLQEPEDRGETNRGTDEDAAKQSTVVTDGGEESKTTVDARRERLLAVFKDVTGADELVVTQEEMNSSRVIDETTTSLSNYVTATMTDDGLTDAIDESERDGSV